MVCFSNLFDLVNKRFRSLFLFDMENACCCMVNDLDFEALLARDFNYLIRNGVVDAEWFK